MKLAPAQKSQPTRDTLRKMGARMKKEASYMTKARFRVARIEGRG